MNGSPPKDRELFGTLLSSRPRRTRSGKSLAIAVGIHLAVVAIAIVTFKPFQPREAHEEFQPISIVVVEDDAVQQLPNLFVRSEPQPVVAAAPAPAKRSEELIYRPGPLAPIVNDPSAAPITEEPDDNGLSGDPAGGSLSSRLLPRGGDPRITAPTAFPPAELTGAEAVRARIADRLSEYNDSLAADAAARYTDWTVKGKDGARWGVTTDTIYLGSIKIPTKRVAFAPPAGKRDEINARLRDYNEIEKQAMLEESRSSFKERVQSIRARKDQERAARNKRPEDKPITESR